MQRTLFDYGLYNNYVKNERERYAPFPFVYMVEDKMKKMKNCYLRLLIYPKDVS